MPGDRSFALLRARARGQRRRRALHPNLEGEPAVGEDLRHHRRAASRTRRVRHSLQRNLARRSARLSYPSPGASRSMPPLSEYNGRSKVGRLSMGTCVHFSRSLPSNSWWQTMAGWQVLSRPSAAEGGGRRPAFTGPATQPYSATEVDGWQHKLSRVSQNRAAVHRQAHRVGTSPQHRPRRAYRRTLAHVAGRYRELRAGRGGFHGPGARPAEGKHGDLLTASSRKIGEPRAVHHDRPEVDATTRQ